MDLGNQQGHLRIRPFAAHEWPLYRQLRLRALADAPDSFARTLAEEQDRSDDEWARRLADSATSPLWFTAIAWFESGPVGFAFARHDQDGVNDVHLYSMWVEPAARKQRIGYRIVEAAIAWARAQRASRVVLKVTEGNLPAISLYKRAGFSLMSDVEPLRAGSPLVARTMLLQL